MQNPTGGWGYLQGLDDDPNSTAVVIQALVAGGQSVTEGRWAEPGGNPIEALLRFQLGCDAEPADQGAFTFPGSDGAPSPLATEQAVWGTSQRAFPLAAVTFDAAPLPCQAPVSVSGSGTAPTSTTSTTAGGDPASTGAVGAAEAVPTAPTFTGMTSGPQSGGSPV